MNRDTVKSTVEIASHVAVVLVSVAVLATLAITFLIKPAGPNLRAGLQKGKPLGQISSVDYSKSDQTLLIALDTNCSACQESLPLHRRLVDSVPQGSSLRITALFPNNAEDVAQYKKHNNFNLDAQANVNLAALNIFGTPTMVLVNSQGEVKDFWLGKIGEREAGEFFRSLNAKNRRSQ